MSTTLIPKPLRVLRWDDIAVKLKLENSLNPAASPVLLSSCSDKAYLCLSSDWPGVFSKCLVLKHSRSGDTDIDYLEAIGNDGRLRTPAGYVNIEPSEGGLATLRLNGSDTSIRSSGTALIHFGGSVIIVSELYGVRGRAVFTSPLESKLIHYDGDFKVLQSATNALVLFKDRKERVRKVYMFDKFQGRFSVFNIPRCIYINGWCGRGLCVIECRECSYSVSLETAHPIPKGLKPLIRCGSAEYYLDVENSLLTLYRDGVLEPLVDEEPIDAVCAGEGILVNCSDGVRMLIGSTSMVISELPANDIGGSRSSILYGINGNYTIATIGSWDRASFNAIKCVLLENDIAWCITRDGLVALSATEFLEPSIRAIREKVDSRGYAVVSLHPWFEGCRYSVEGPVNVIASMASGNTLRLTLRPKRLGWCGHAYITLESPIFTLGQKVWLSSSEPTLSKLEITECAYAPEGRLVSDAECNFKAKLNVVVKWPDPRDPQVTVKASGQDLLKSVKVLNVRRLEDDLRELSILLMGRHSELSKPLIISVILKAGDEETYVIGKTSVQLVKYVLRNPFSESKPALLKESNQTTVKSMEDASISVLCANNRVFEGIGHVGIIECLEPAVVKEVIRKGCFEWTRESIIGCHPSIIIENNDSFSTSLTKHVEGGLICVEPVLKLPDTHNISCNVEDIDISGNARGGCASIRISCNASSPSYVLAKAGNSVLIKLGWKERRFSFTVSAPLTELLLNGVDIYSVTLAGKHSTTVVRNKDILLKTLYKCHRIARELLNAMEVGEFASVLKTAKDAR